MLTVGSHIRIFDVEIINHSEQIVPDTFPAGLGEPINVILTGKSDADVLKDQETDGGLRNYFLCVMRPVKLVVIR